MTPSLPAVHHPAAAAPSRWMQAWPLPALAAWALAWACSIALARAGWPGWPAVAAGTGCGLACALALRGASRWRRGFVAAGFPLSLAVVTLASPGTTTAWPAWAWLLPLAALLLIYPLRAWRDAPLFPTPAGALDELSTVAPLATGARVLDIGCGLGDGLAALRRAYPQARIEGIEHSAPLAWLAALRCRFARVRRGDMWREDWGGYELIYLFQRPETMARAAAKAEQEMAPGAWLVSLEFEIAGRAPQARLAGAQGRPVWVYRIAGVAAARKTGGQAGVQDGGPQAGNSRDREQAKNSSRRSRRR